MSSGRFSRQGRRTFSRVAPFPLPLDVSYADACEDVMGQLCHDIEGFHEFIVDQFGGVPGIRSQSQLEAAIARPFVSFGLQSVYSTGVEQASALAYALVQNHPFVDGNKRTALYSCLYFLQQCGYWRHELYLTRHESQSLEKLILMIAREGEDIQKRRIHARYENHDLAVALDQILAGSRNRRPVNRRLRNGIFRPLLHIFRSHE